MLLMSQARTAHAIFNSCERFCGGRKDTEEAGPCCGVISGLGEAQKEKETTLEKQISSFVTKQAKEEPGYHDMETAEKLVKELTLAVWRKEVIPNTVLGKTGVL